MYTPHSRIDVQRRAVRGLAVVALLVGLASTAQATGLLIPTDRGLKCLGIVHQRVDVKIEEQVAVTRVEQVFRNSASRQLEAHYIFPLPPGANVQDFALWIDGKRVSAELVEADKARKVYEDIVRRMKDPGLLEHMGNDLWRVRVFPVPANGTQKIEITYSQVVPADNGIAEYVYPLKTGNESVRTEKDFSVRIDLKSSRKLGSVYSPSHDIGLDRKGDHHAIVGFEASHYPLDRDFRLYWTLADGEVGLSLLTHRVSPGEPGTFMLLISPTFAAKQQRVPRDVVFVVDTSGSMRGEKIEQAKKALQFCLDSLSKEDRFAIIRFATTVEAQGDGLSAVEPETIDAAKEWVGELEATGGTDIDQALREALARQSERPASQRNFTIVFLTDGQPTVGETNATKIAKAVEEKNTAETRIFSFGVGDDVNALLIDELAETTRGTSVYVRPGENLETKVSSFYAKISHPVLTNLKLSTGKGVKFTEMYPPKLPDLFFGSQLVVLGRYEGSGATAISLRGNVGRESQKFVHDANLPKEDRDADFLPGLWARRKVGYLLDQIRQHGESKELVDEVTRLAKEHGIATPYTSYLVVEEEPPAIAHDRLLRRLGEVDDDRFGVQWGLRRNSRGAAPALPAPGGAGGAPEAPALQQREGLMKRKAGREAVDVAQELEELKSSTAATAPSQTRAPRKLADTTFTLVDGVWTDAAAKGDQKTVTVKYLSDAYFRVLELLPKAKEALALGDHVVWVTPGGVVLKVSPDTGLETLDDATAQQLAGK